MVVHRHDEVVPQTKLEELAVARAKERAAASKRVGAGEGITLTPISRKVTADSVEYSLVNVVIDRAMRVATVTIAGPDAPPPDEQERILLRELGEYRPELLERPRLTVGTKSDSAVHDWDGATLSSITNQGVRELVGRMATLVHQARAVEPDSEGLVIIRPQADSARVERVGEREFRLVGRQVERVVALNDVTTPEALSYIDHQLKRLGVTKMLAKAGARQGDVVWIAGFSFEYHEGV